MNFSLEIFDPLTKRISCNHRVPAQSSLNKTIISGKMYLKKVTDQLMGTQCLFPAKCGEKMKNRFIKAVRSISRNNLPSRSQFAHKIRIWDGLQIGD